jgi:hypothetical protein
LLTQAAVLDGESALAFGHLVRFAQLVNENGIWFDIVTLRLKPKFLTTMGVILAPHCVPWRHPCRGRSPSTGQHEHALFGGMRIRGDGPPNQGGCDEMEDALCSAVLLPYQHRSILAGSIAEARGVVNKS